METKNFRYNQDVWEDDACIQIEPHKGLQTIY